MIENSQKGHLTHMQQMMCLPLLARAMESVKTEPGIIDDLAVQIALKLDAETRRKINQLPEFGRLAWISLNIRLDKLINDFLSRYPGATVVNIRCGMDTTYDRLKNESVMWYDLDLPDVIQFRKKLIPESPRHRYIETSFLNHEWLDMVRYENNILFLARGVFYYYKEQSIRRFILSLVHYYPRFEIVFDVISGFGIRIRKLLLKYGIISSPNLYSIGVLSAGSPRIILLEKFSCFEGIRIKMNWKQTVFKYLFNLFHIHSILHYRVRPDYRHLVKRT